jgi:hypothetical protein
MSPDISLGSAVCVTGAKAERKRGSPALLRGSVVLIALVGAGEPVQWRSCGNAPDDARNGACLAQAIFRCVMMAAIRWNPSIRSQHFVERHAAAAVDLLIEKLGLLVIDSRCRQRDVVRAVRKLRDLGEEVFDGLAGGRAGHLPSPRVRVGRGAMLFVLCEPAHLWNQILPIEYDNSSICSHGDVS